MRNLRTDAAQPVRLPGLDLLKRATDPVLSGIPDWLRAIVWATLVMTLLYVVMWWLFRHGLPWISQILIPPTRTVIELGGVALLLPGYLVSTVLRRVGGAVPGVMFLYDDLVQNLTKGCHWTAATLLNLSAGLRSTSKLVLAVLLVALVGLWDVTYCTGAGNGCVIPTSQWVGSVSRAVNAHKPTPTPTPCPKKHRSRHAPKCASGHRSSGTNR